MSGGSASSGDPASASGASADGFGDDPSSAADGSGDDQSGAEPPGVPATKRNRAKSAALWGLVGGFTFLVLAQGYLLFGGGLPFRYPWLFGVGVTVTAGSSVTVYLTEHRVRSKRRT